MVCLAKSSVDMRHHRFASLTRETCWPSWEVCR
ncbi:unnamed protein product [Spirodela intermedia]|uniref:Uncharacterized protein n=1 Tax=Spirodela intermedia TaxID=51605 RepID=A0A7I8JQH5_SPIIN|nr:unnamed protein product [Spirodela intermedia]CAA6672418.1 unnamed protein product [Spirodela intermedia]